MVGTGKVNHEQLLKVSEKWLGSLKNENLEKVNPKNLEPPLHTPSIVNVRDDEMNSVNTAVGFVFKKPSPEFYVLKFFEEIMGSYNAGQDGFAHLNFGNR